MNGARNHGDEQGAHCADVRKPERDAGPEASGGDERLLRWVIGVPLVLLHLVAAFLCFSALHTRPGHPGDEDAFFAIKAFAVLTIATETLALLITLAPSHRAALNRWWLAPPIALILTAVVRLVLPV
ncbi:hypothetical protein [Streptomyces cinereoruber]|uniref:hypothetical protein n=1 Tax=Streptomyces cinereoruber TaxID=67260 RepID=UPI003C2AF3A1